MFNTEIAIRNRKCFECRLVIQKGEPCLVFYGGDGGYSAKKNICKLCAKKIIKELKEFRKC